MPPLDDEEDLDPVTKRPAAVAAPAAPRTGETGGTVPEFDSDKPRAPIKWAADPTQRQAQVTEEITRRRQEKNAAAHPFQPTSWSTNHREPGSIKADREFENQAENQFQYQQQQDRAAVISDRRAALETQKTANDKVEAEYRGTGQQFYTDSHGKIQPVIDAESKRPLYHTTAWEPGKHPKTGMPTLTMRDKFGQRQYKDAPVVAGLDPTDDQLYYKMPDGSTAPAGSIDEMVAHPNYNIAKTALAAKTRNVKAVRQQALEPLKVLADQSASQLEEARRQVLDMDEQIAKATEQANNQAGTPAGEGMMAAIGQLQAKRDALDGRTKAKGDLATQVSRSKAGYAIASAQAMHDAFDAQQNEILARVRATGVKPEDDPTYMANLRGMQSAAQILKSANDAFAGIDVAPTSEPMSNLNPLSPVEPVITPAGGGSLLQQSEPYMAAKNGVKNIGGVSLQEFARRYGSGQGDVKPDSVIKLYKRSKELEETLSNEDTAVNATLRGQMTKEKEYIDSLAAQRFGRLDPNTQKRITDSTRDPTFWEKAKGAALAVGRGAGKALVDVGEFAARNADQVPNLLVPGVTRLTPAPVRAAQDQGKAVVGEVADAMREGAESYTASDAPAVEQKLREGSLTGAIPEAVGGVLPFAAGGALIGSAGKAMGLADSAISGLTRAATAAAGGAQAGNSLRREAINHLRPDLESGKITQEQYNKAVGLAELSGAGIGGAAMSLAPLTKFATRLNNIPAGKTFLAGLLDRAAKGGSNSAMKWLAGEGGSKVLSEVVREGTEMAGVTFAQDLATDLAAQKTFDPSRKIDPARAGESAAQMGAVGAILSVLTHIAPKPNGPAAAETGEPTKPLTPDQQAAETEFQKRLAEPAAPATPEPPKLAEESAKTFEPALAERANTPPPAKSAKDSAEFIQGETKRLADAEKESQDLVDQLSEITGKPREKIIEERGQKEGDAWRDELKKEVEYQRHPLTVDPERRSTELRADLKKLDSDWAKHVDQVSAEADIAAGKDARREDIEKNISFTKERHDRLMARRDAIEGELTKADRLRQSAKGAEDLRGDLTAEQQKAQADSRKLPTPELEARRDAIEGGLDQRQQDLRSTAKAAENKADLAVESAPNPGPEAAKTDPTKLKEVQEAIKNPNARYQYSVWDRRMIPEGHDRAAQIDIIDDSKSEADRNVSSSNRALLNELGVDLPAVPESLPPGRYTPEQIREAIAKESKSNEPQNTRPVQQAEPAKPAVTEVAKAEGTPLVAGENQKADEAVTAPIASGNPTKDAAPVSAKVVESTPEKVEGPKIGKDWTAFSKESGSLNIPRSEMPQIKSEHRGALVNFLKARDIPAKAVMVRPGQLKPTQAEFSPEKVQSAREYTGSERPILITSDGHVVDGHHQWMAALDDKDTPMPAIRLDAPVDRVLAEMKEFPSVENAAGAAPKAAAAAPQATKRLSDRAIEALQKAKINTNGKVFDATQGLYVAAHNAAIDLAILGVRAGRAVNDVVKLAIDRFKAKHKDASQDQLTKLESDIRNAIETRPPEPKPGTAKSRLPESLRNEGLPVKDIEYDVRAQNERMSEARSIIDKKGTADAEQMIGDRNLPADTRVAIGGVLLEKKMEALKNASPDQVSKLTAEIQRIAESTRSGVSTESGQGVAMHSKIYENLSVGSAMEYVNSATKKRVQQMGGKDMEAAAKEAADAFNKTTSKEERDAAIDKLKEKYTTTPVRRALDALKRVETAKELNKLGVLTRDDMVNVAGNALGIPGIDQSKLKHIADLASKVDTAKNHAERSRAELALADTLSIYKGVNPLDLEASILTLNILSGPTTQMANLEGNALNLIAQLGTTAAVNPTKIGPIMKGLMDGIPLGWDQAKSIMATGRGSKDFQDVTGSGSALSSVDYARDFSKLNKTVGDTLTLRARAVDKISRLMKAADATFYYPAREAYARLAATKLLEGEFKGQELADKVSETLHTTPGAFLKARQQGMAEGYEGIDLGRRVADIIEENRSKTSVGKEAVKHSENFAAEATFNNEPVGLAGVIYRNLARTVRDTDINGVPVLKPWAMFLRVPANVFNATTNFTPVGAARATFGMKGENYVKNGTGEGQWRNFTKDERNRLYLQSVIGTTLMGGLTARILSKNDVNITASGPNDPNKKKQLQASGWSPYSIKIGNRWVSYKDSPLLVPLAIVGHVADAVRYQKSKSDLVLESRVADAVASAPQIIFQTSMLSGLADLMGSLSGKGDSSVGAVTRTLASIPANLVIPYNRLLQQIDQTFDHKIYKNNPIVGAVPFARRGDPKDAKKDVQGRDIDYAPSSRFSSTEKNDPVDNILRDKNVFIPEIGKDSKVGNRVMTDDEHTKYRNMSGQRIRVRLMAIAPQLRMMNQEQAQKRIDQVSREEREKIRPLIAR